MDFDFELIKNQYVMNKLFKEEIKIFFEHGLLTEEQYNEIINI